MVPSAEIVAKVNHPDMTLYVVTHPIKVAVTLPFPLLLMDTVDLQIFPPGSNEAITGCVVAFAGV